MAPASNEAMSDGMGGRGFDPLDYGRPMPTLRRETLALFAFTYVIGLVMLMTAGIYDGPLAEPSLLLVMGCVGLLCVLFVRLLLGRPLRLVEGRAPLLLLLVAFAVSTVAVFADARLLIHGERPPRLIHAVEVAEFCLLATYLPAVIGRGREGEMWARLRFASFAALFLAGGISVMFLSPHPKVDVWEVQTEGARALLRAQNPYDLLNVHVEDQGLGNFPHIAFPYPPTPCGLNAIAFALGGDVRWGVLAALLGTGVAFRQIVRSSVSRPTPASPVARIAEDAPALLLWLTPKAYFFLETSWNDAYPLMLATMSVLGHVHGRRYISAAFLGLTLSAKQSMIWFLPLAVLLGFSLRQWIVVLTAAAAPLVPFALWDFRAFKYWTVDHFLLYAPKPESLTPMNWLSRHFGIGQPKTPPGVFAAAFCSVVGAWRAPRTPYAFALVATLACFSFYLFNRFTCMNYYFFAAGLGALAAAASMVPRPPIASSSL